jgi:hypothetical protein
MRCITTSLLVGTFILCLYVTGCGSFSTAESLGGGYEEVTYTQPSIFMEQDAHRFALQYRNREGRLVAIWPSVPSGPDVANGIAVFVADAAREPRDPDEPRSTMRRLFAVRAPELPLDITDEVLWQWSKTNKIDFAEALKIASVVTLNKKEGQLEIRFAFWNNDDWPRLVTLDWNQISAIMSDVKGRGVVRKDRVWGASYMDGAFNPEVQK